MFALETNKPIEKRSLAINKYILMKWVHIYEWTNILESV